MRSSFADGAVLYEGAINYVCRETIQPERSSLKSAVLLPAKRKERMLKAGGCKRKAMDAKARGAMDAKARQRRHKQEKYALNMAKTGRVVNQ